jgi:NADH-quinone oxidoreductase subunit N
MEALELVLVLPVLVLVAWSLLILLFRTSPDDADPGVFGILLAPSTWSLLGVTFAGWALVKQWSLTAVEAQTTAYGMVHVDRFGVYMSLVVLGAGFLTLLFSSRFLKREGADEPEFYAMALLALAGMILIGLETFSLTFYVLCGLTRGRARAVEAALKYFLLGAFSSGFLVYGLALTYGATGTLSLSEIAAGATSHPPAMLSIGLGLIVVGFAFKIAAVPFHQWVPDVYTGAPTNVTGFMAAATKAVAFAALLRVLVGAFADKSAVWIPLVTWLAVLTMTVANLVALAQTNIKRLLAFSSIAHAGYLLIAVACLPALGVRAILFYLTTYAFMTIGAFAVAAAVGGGDEHAESGYDFITSWAGLGRRQPLLAGAMTVFLLSMAGIPPTGGFFGKYLIFQAAVESKAWLLAVVGSLNAVVAAYYYLAVIMTMWFKEPDGEAAVAAPLPPSFAAVLTIAVVAILYLGLAPSWVLGLASGLATSLT